jgi:hypothetical protein
MAIDFGRAARGIATGYLTAKVADTAAQDELNRDFILQARNQYYNVDKPNFVADEKKREANIKLIASEINPIVANYADYTDRTLDKPTTLRFIEQVKNLSDDERFNLESTITERKKERTQTFDDKHAHVLNDEMFKSGGTGSMNMMKMFFPKEGEDIAEVGVKQDAMPMAEKVTPLSEIIGTGSGVYNFDEHGTERREFINFFNGTFTNRVSGAPEINVGPSDPRYDLQQYLKEGFEEAKKNGFIGGEYLYMMNKFVDGEFKKQGVTGYPTGFEKPAEAATTEAAATTTETKAVPEDGKKFDAPDTSQIGVKEDAKINILSNRTMEGGGTSSAAVVLNDLREIIAKISDSPSLSDDEKEKRIELAKQRARDRIESMGLDLNKFNI